MSDKSYMPSTGRRNNTQMNNDGENTTTNNNDATKKINCNNEKDETTDTSQQSEILTGDMYYNIVSSKNVSGTDSFISNNVSGSVATFSKANSNGKTPRSQTNSNVPKAEVSSVTSATTSGTMTSTFNHDNNTRQGLISFDDIDNSLPLLYHECSITNLLTPPQTPPTQLILPDKSMAIAVKPSRMQTLGNILNNNHSHIQEEESLAELRSGPVAVYASLTPIEKSRKVILPLMITMSILSLLHLMTTCYILRMKSMPPLISNLGRIEYNDTAFIEDFFESLPTTSVYIYSAYILLDIYIYVSIVFRSSLGFFVYTSTLTSLLFFHFVFSLRTALDIVVISLGIWMRHISSKLEFYCSPQVFCVQAK